MFLKRLTMRGFKSFADHTVLEFEPGVTAVVGPNGSGKSNVVDAVTWVLGAQSTRALRSARMDDVIFMGTATRAALGRAEVTLTLDNSSGRLGVDGAEVTIARTLFRNGDSEYAINGTTCRLLDVQELLGDSGVGRQQHMIIGQGQLDSILSSNPENRRAVIEEAAGVLKHRRRKERAERRLATTQDNLERLGDLVREVRRQMRPLERQAASARSYADVAGELNDVRHALFAQRLAEYDERRVALEHALATGGERERHLRDELVTLDARATAAATEMASRREEMLASTLGTLQGLAERARGTSSVIKERERALRQALIASADENVIATLEADAAQLTHDLAALALEERSLGELRAQVAARREEATRLEEEFETVYASSSVTGDDAALRAAHEQLALLERSRSSVEDNVQRLRARRDETQRRSEELARVLEEQDRVETQAARTRTDAEAALARAEAALVAARSAFDEADAELSESADRASRAQARAETLARAFEELSGAGGRAIIGELEGVLGSFLDLIDVDPGAERAVEAAAGASVGAMVVDGRTSARAALAALRREGGAGLILTVGEGDVEPLNVPAGCTSLRALVHARAGAPAHVERVLDALFRRAFVAPDWESGMEVALAQPDLVIVTTEGDRFAPSGWRVASGRAVVTSFNVDDAQAAAAKSAEDVAQRREAHSQARRDLDEALRRRDDALAQVGVARHDEVSARELVARQRTDHVELTKLLASLDAELAPLVEQIAALELDIAQLSDRLPGLEEAVREGAAREGARKRAREEMFARRRDADELTATLVRREGEYAERRRLIEQRQLDVEARLAGRSGERREAATRRESLEFDRAVLERLAALVERAAEDIALSQGTLDSSYREQLEATRASAELLDEVRRLRQQTELQLGELLEQLRRDQIEQAELAVRVSNVHEAIRRDVGREPHELGPAPLVELAPGVTLEARAAELEARVSSLGPINPLALEELASLEERFKELDAQVSDVRHARRELQEVLRALDDEIMQTFASAFADVNEHFSSLIAMLFPGGQGRLHLSEPEDPLNTGVEIEVRPMGRNVRRISLLSGGERSMAALAFLFSVFRSRPSPFYLMDEVEAALDDVNLQRFLSLVDEFRDEAQLLIVTHQKRTMEAADALYGVTMVPGASSKVVSQRVRRVREEEPA